MKRKLAALSAALLLLTACSANFTSTQAIPTEPVSTLETESPVSQTETQPKDVVKLPTEENGMKPVVTEEPAPTEFLDEPYTYQVDLEEVVSISLTLPKITLDSQEASDKINAVFEKFQNNLYDFASGTVYATAQEKNAIGFLEGSYSSALDDGVLAISYTLEVRYSSEEASITHENVYRFDARTGEQLDA